MNEASKKTLIESNPFPHIFISDNAYSLFNKFIKPISTKTELADYSFIYRIMLKDNLIYDVLRESDYRRWIDKEYQVNIDKTKTLKYCTTPLKEFTYKLLKEHFDIV